MCSKKLLKAKMAMQLEKSSSLDRRSSSRNMQVAAFNVFPSVSSKERIFIVLQRERMSTCADVMDVKSNIARPRARAHKNT